MCTHPAIRPFESWNQHSSCGFIGYERSSTGRKLLTPPIKSNVRVPRRGSCHQCFLGAPQPQVMHRTGQGWDVSNRDTSSFMHRISTTDLWNRNLQAHPFAACEGSASNSSAPQVDVHVSPQTVAIVTTAPAAGVSRSAAIQKAAVANETSLTSCRLTISLGADVFEHKLIGCTSLIQATLGCQINMIF